jgi:hypothetical protein
VRGHGRPKRIKRRLNSQLREAPTRSALVLSKEEAPRRCWDKSGLGATNPETPTRGPESKCTLAYPSVGTTQSGQVCNRSTFLCLLVIVKTLVKRGKPALGGRFHRFDACTPIGAGVSSPRHITGQNGRFLGEKGPFWRRVPEVRRTFWGASCITILQAASKTDLYKLESAQIKEGLVVDLRPTFQSPLRALQKARKKNWGIEAQSL